MMSLFCLLVAMALPFTKPAFQVTVEKDVPYATAPGYYTHAPIGDKGATVKLMFHSGIPKPVTLEMDIYEPVGDDISAKRPLLLMMHGGSFFIGNKSEPGQRGWGQYFASLGYVAVSIDYRLGFHALKKEIRLEETSDTCLDGNAELYMVGCNSKESTITVRLYNNADIEIRTFGLPTQVIGGRSEKLDWYSNMDSDTVEVAPDTYADIVYHIDPAIFEEGGRIEGELFIMGPSLSDRYYSLDVVVAEE